jgi:hypothetical protein
VLEGRIRRTRNTCRCNAGPRVWHKTRLLLPLRHIRIIIVIVRVALTAHVIIITFGAIRCVNAVVIVVISIAIESWRTSPKWSNMGN